MKKRDQLTLLGGVGLGAGLMYLLDPQGGGRRRALAHDKALHGYKVGSQFLHKASIDASNRSRGLAAQLQHRLRSEAVDDVVLEERVRSKIGHCVSHPSAIRVEARGGRVILSGPILASEMDELLVKVYKVRGVQGVESRLKVHESPEDMPALQGEPQTNGRFSLRNVKPRTAALGGLGALAGVVGLGLLAGKKARPSGQLGW